MSHQCERDETFDNLKSRVTHCEERLSAVEGKQLDAQAMKNRMNAVITLLGVMVAVGLAIVGLSYRAYDTASRTEQAVTRIVTEQAVIKTDVKWLTESKKEAQ